MKSKAEKAIKEIAKSNGISIDEVKKEMADAIKAAMQNSNPSAQLFWKNVKEDISPEEFIELIASKISTKK